MGSFTTEATKASQIQTETAVAEVYDQRDGNRSKRQGGTEHSDYDVVGINVFKVPEMRDAIRTYVQNIQAELDKIGENTNASQNKALQSIVIRESLDLYIRAVKSYSQDLVSYMLTFSDKLVDVQKAWAKFSSTTSENISTASGAMGFHHQYTERL